MMTTVLKRSGYSEPFVSSKLKTRILRLSTDLLEIDSDLVVDDVIRGAPTLIEATQLDVLTSETAVSYSSRHPSYNNLAGRIVVAKLHKETKPSFFETMRKLHESSLISNDLYYIATGYAKQIESVIDYQRDFDYDFFGIQTMCKSYLTKLNGKIVERPQHMLMRVALALHSKRGNSNDIILNMKEAFETYRLLSTRKYTHASPTLFNAGTNRPQLASCFLLSMKEDSIEGIYETLKQCASISKYAGGIGVGISCIRAAGSYIAGSNGISNGVTPMLRVFNATARYVDQGGGKRKGAIAMYLEPWHADIFEFLELKKNTGPDELRARDLFFALWIPDLFMKRVKADDQWSLMCPAECPGLHTEYGAAFDTLYTLYEIEGKYRRRVPARKLWEAILDSQIESGGPYQMYKDACNRKSNQKNLGTIGCSNLCTEILEYSSPTETAVCNLASVSLKEFVVDHQFDHHGLHDVIKTMTRNLNKVIDCTFYPVEEARRSNLRHRPIGLGVQGLADAFFRLKIAFDSKEAAQLNVDIFETIYHAACEASMEIAQQEGSYSTFQGSPASQGLLQFDLWNVIPSSGRYDWTTLKKQIIIWGMRNSLLVAPMPTASTAQILGNTECFEPCMSNIYSRSTSAGTFTLVNDYLVNDLIDLSLWSDSMRQRIVAADGSIQAIDEIPQSLKDIYKTVWEISQKTIVAMSLARGPYIDQSQSLNIHIKHPTYEQLTSMHFDAWEGGAKTGMYYLRTRPSADPIKFTVDVKPDDVCTMEDGCLSCGS